MSSFKKKFLMLFGVTLMLSIFSISITPVLAAELTEETKNSAEVAADREEFSGYTLYALWGNEDLYWNTWNSNGEDAEFADMVLPEYHVSEYSTDRVPMWTIKGVEPQMSYGESGSIPKANEGETVVLTPHRLAFIKEAYYLTSTEGIDMKNISYDVLIAKVKESGTKIERNSDGKFSFKMPDSDVYLYVDAFANYVYLNMTYDESAAGVTLSNEGCEDVEFINGTGTEGRPQYIKYGNNYNYKNDNYMGRAVKFSGVPTGKKVALTRTNEGGSTSSWISVGETLSLPGISGCRYIQKLNVKISLVDDDSSQGPGEGDNTDESNEEKDVTTTLIKNLFTLNPNGGTFSNETLEENKDHIVKKDDATGALSFYYWKDTYKDGTVKCGYSLSTENDFAPSKDGYSFLGWYEKNENGTPNFNKPFRFSYITEEQCVDAEYIAAWAKNLPAIDEKNIKTETVDGKYLRTVFTYNKDELKSLYNEETEALLVLYESWTKVPNSRNDQVDKNGNYVNWNAAPVDFNYNPFVFVRDLYDKPVENDTDAWIRYKYVVIKKDTVNNPNNYILNRWSNNSNILREASTWSKEFKDTLISEKQAAGGDIVEEDTRYDNIATVTRKELTASNTEVTQPLTQAYTGDYLRPNVAVKYKEEGSTKAITLVEGTDYIKTYSNNLNAGTAKIIIKGNGLYKGTIEKEFTIAPKSAKKLKVTVGAVKAGDASTVLLENNFISVFDGIEVLKKDSDYTVDVSKADLSKGGKTNIIVKGKNNYTEEEINVPVTVIELKEGEELIRTASIKASEAANLIYKGVAYKFTAEQFEVSTGTRVLQPTEYSVAAKNVKDVGTGYITIKSRNKSVKGSVVIPVEILPIANTSFEIDGKDNISAVVYNGKLQRPKVKVTSVVNNKTVTLKLNKDYKLTYSNNIHATNGEKKAEIKVVGIGNYASANAVSAYFEIKPIAISKVKATGTKGNIKLIFNNHEIVNTVDYTLSDWTDASAKKSSVTITGKGDFTGEITKTFAIPVAK